MSLTQFDVDRVSTIDKTHSHVHNYENLVFGPHKIFKHLTTNELVLVKEKTTNSKIELSHDSSNVEKRYNLRHANLLEMKDWSIIKKSQMCATFYQIKTYFHYHPTNLLHLIA